MDDIEEMNEMRAGIGLAWKAMSPEQRVSKLRETADSFAADVNRFMTAPPVPGAVAIENQIAALCAVVEILLHVTIAEAESHG